MAVEQLIERLRTATSPTRNLDAKIAETLGWTKRIDMVQDDVTGEEKAVATWIRPGGTEPGKVPNFTSNLQHAMDLAQQLVPSHVGGCSWEDGTGSARINDGPFVQAMNPQTALCIAALLSLR
jgi:hypothetical protein